VSHLSQKSQQVDGKNARLAYSNIYPGSDPSSATSTVLPSPTRATAGPWSLLARRIIKTHGSLALTAQTGHPTRGKWEKAALSNMKKRS